MKVVTKTTKTEIYLGLEDFQKWLVNNKLFISYTNRLHAKYGFDIMPPIHEACQTKLPRNLFNIIDLKVAAPPKNAEFKDWYAVIKEFEADCIDANVAGICDSVKSQAVEVPCEPYKVIQMENSEVFTWLQQQGCLAAFINNVLTQGYDLNTLLAEDAYLLIQQIEWKDTPEGEKYWETIDSKWEEFLNVVANTNEE